MRRGAARRGRRRIYLPKVLKSFSPLGLDFRLGASQLVNSFHVPAPPFVGPPADRLSDLPFMNLTE